MTGTRLLDDPEGGAYARGPRRGQEGLVNEGTLRVLTTTLALALLAAGCTPKVQVEAPKEPIVINMNVKIEHEIRVKVDKDLDKVFENENLF
jgi:uncharacterized membrane protein